MKVFEAIANALNELSVSEVFGLMGDGNLKLLTYWTSEMDKGYHGTRHESAAIGMADGYFRATGNVGVCTMRVASLALFAGPITSGYDSLN